MISKIDTIDTSIEVEEPEWIDELVNDKPLTKWGHFKSIFRKEKSFDLNSGISIDSRTIVSRDFILLSKHESPRFGENSRENYESFVSEIKPSKSTKYKYQLISLMSKKFQLTTPKFEDMGKGSFTLFWEQFKSNFS